MPAIKRKTHKGLKKRIRVTATGLVKFKAPNSGHLMSTKSGRRCRKLRKPKILLGRVRAVILEAVAYKA